MIVSFKNKEVEKIYNQEFSRKIPTSIQNKVLMKLMILDDANKLEDLRNPPSNHFEKLHGYESRYSIRINKQYRICFTVMNDIFFYDVDVEDYH